MSSAESQPTTEQKIVDAGPPFDDPGADIILRSKDCIDFRVLKVFLSYASPMFAAMFTLPQPQGQNTEGPSRDGIPVVVMEEGKGTVEAIVRCCYPRGAMEEPTFDTLGDVVDALKASRKYEMDGVETCIRKVLVEPRFVEKEPLRVFSIALSNSLEMETKIAGRQTLRLPLLGRQYVPELEFISGGAYHRLQAYHQRCSDLARNVAMAKSMEWVTKDTFVWLDCTACIPRASPVCVNISGNRIKWVYSRWWIEFMHDAQAALQERPFGATVQCPKMLAQALIRANGCTNCQSRALIDMNEFCEEFAAEVNRAVSEVSRDAKVFNMYRRR